MFHSTNVIFNLGQVMGDKVQNLNGESTQKAAGDTDDMLNEFILVQQPK